MAKEILTFEDIEIEKKIFTAIRLLFIGRCRIVSNKISFGEKNYKILYWLLV